MCIQRPKNDKNRMAQVLSYLLLLLLFTFSNDPFCYVDWMAVCVKQLQWFSYWFSQLYKIRIVLLFLFIWALGNSKRIVPFSSHLHCGLTHSLFVPDFSMLVAAIEREIKNLPINYEFSPSVVGSIIWKC